MPSHAEIIAARDRVVARHPKLRCVGAHLGSLEYSVEEMAKRFDAFPNYVVDNSARTPDLAYLDRDSVRAFMDKYQDRILFGTDIVKRTPHSMLTDEERTSILIACRENYTRTLKYFSTDEPVTYIGHEFKGLKLSETILKKFFTDNAQRWYPGL